MVDPSDFACLRSYRGGKLTSIAAAQALPRPCNAALASDDRWNQSVRPGSMAALMVGGIFASRGCQQATAIGRPPLKINQHQLVAVFCGFVMSAGWLECA
jgi:hypothetical protein